MSKFRKKPVVIEATQWFKNGDARFVNENKHTFGQKMPYNGGGRGNRTPLPYESTGYKSGS